MFIPRIVTIYALKKFLDTNYNVKEFNNFIYKFSLTNLLIVFLVV